MARRSSIKTVILIAMIIIGGGIMFYFGIQYQGSVNSNNENSAGNSNQASNDVVYTNDTYNYQITLPAGWSTEEGSPDYVSFMDPDAQAQEIVSELMQGMKMEIWATEVSGVTLEDAVNAEMENYADDEIIETSDVSVDGQEAVKVKMYVLGYSITSYVIENDVFYKIVGYVGNEQEDSKYVALYSKILSDFKFLD